MKNNIKKIVLFCAIVLSTSLFCQEIPKYNGTLVNDFANIIPDEQEVLLRTLVKDYENKTSIQMCVVTISSLYGQNVDDYTNTLFRNWGIGQKGLNNGLLVLIAPNERKWRIEVGYGLEEWITDSYSKSVGELNFKPNFRKGDYYSGIKGALSNFMSTLGEQGWTQRQEFVALKKKQNDEAFNNFMGWLVFGLIAIFSVIISVVVYRRNKKAEERRKELELERERIRQKNEKIRLEKINTAKIKKNNIEKEFLETKTKLDLLQNKNFNGYEELIVSLNDAQNKIGDILRLNPETDSDSIIQKHNSVSGQLKLIMSELIENESIISDVNNSFKKLSNTTVDIKMTVAGVENMLKKLRDNYSELPAQSDESNLRFRIERLLDSYSNGIETAKKYVDSGDYKKAKEFLNEANKQFDACTNSIRNATSIEEKVRSANAYVKHGKQTIEPLVALSEKLSKDSDVKSSTKSMLKSTAEEAVKFSPEKYLKNPLSGQKILIDLVNNVDSAISKAKQEIRNAESERERERQRIAEEKRRKKREEEEEEDRIRRNSYSSSSSFGSSYDSSSSSSSSYDSGSSFGGGDSGGGGSSGDW